MKRLIPIILVLLMIGISPVVSLAGELEDAQERVRLYPGNAEALYKLGYFYCLFRRHQEAIATFKQAIRLNPNDFDSHTFLGASSKSRFERTWIGLYLNIFYT